MPTFGDYETTGEPLAMSDGIGHLSQIWLARKTTENDGRQYVIKIFLPRPRRRPVVDPEGELEEDRALDFLESVKQLKRAQTEGGKAGSRLTPIYDFGKTPEGNAAWYVTDLYGEAEPFLSGSLQSYIIRGGRVDAAALAHIVHSVVAACLALQRARGYSHGNLKSSNVFRVGKSKPLRSTPLQVGDSLVAVPTQLNSAPPEDLKSVSELLAQTMEAQDLRTIGELLLQLVEGRVILSDRDYDFPVQDSPAWARLGKDAARWRELCNRLLDPGLSLERVSLQGLEKEFRPSPITQPMVGVALAVICTLTVVGIFYGHSRKKQSRQPPAQVSTPQVVQKPQEQTTATGAGSTKPAVLPPRQTGPPAQLAQLATELQAAQQAFNSSSGDYVTNLIAALQHVNAALILAPDDPPAVQLKNKIAGGMTAAAASALQNGVQFAAQGNLRDAMKERALISAFKPDDPGLPQLSSNIFRAADIAATNAIETKTNTVNLDEGERNWKYMQAIAPSDRETIRVKSLVDIFDKLIAKAVSQAQVAINTDVKTLTDANNLLAALNGAGLFDWRPSRTNATQKLVEKLDQKRRDGIAAAFEGSTGALQARNIQDANNRLEIIKTLNPSDPLVAKLAELIRDATVGAPTPTQPPNNPAPAPIEKPTGENRGPTNVLGIDFVWLKDAGNGGAYVAVNELSRDLWHALDGGNAGRGGDPGVPAMFPNVNEARAFVARQADAFLNQGFRVRLPTLNEYAAMIGIKTAQTSALSAGERNKIKHTELPDSPKALPSRVSDGQINANGFRNALGNVREWTSDSANPFGYAYFLDREFFAQSPYDNLNAPPRYGEQVGGVRFVLEPK